MSSTTTNVLKKTRDGTYNPNNDGPEIGGPTSIGVHSTQSVVTNVTAELERALRGTTADIPVITNKPIKPLSPKMPIKLTSKGAIQLTSSSDTYTTNKKVQSIPSVHLDGNNPFFHEKRRWEDSFDAAEKQALPGNIVKAAKDKNGETYVTLQEEEFVGKPTPSKDSTKATSEHSSVHEDESQDSDGLESTISKKPGRKPMPDEEITSDSEQDPKVKRKAQNRAAQRAFRERKERYVKELETRIKQVQDAHFIATAHLVQENQQLRAIIFKLESENCALKGIPIQPYQHLYQAPPPQNIQALQQLRMSNTNSNITGSSASYPNIAPLLPNTLAAATTNNTQQMILPAYLSSTSAHNNAGGSVAAASPLIHTASPSVNQMLMLASSSLQQYPMSPVISTDMAQSSNGVHQSTASSTLSTAPTTSASATKKQHKNNQPLEYTFSISTPASLRSHNGNSSSSSSKNQRSEHIEPVPLYPPGLIRQQKQKPLSPVSSEQQQVQPEREQNQERQNQASAENTAIDKNEPSAEANKDTLNANTATTPSSSAASISSHQDSPHQQHQIASLDDSSSIISDKTASTANTQRKKMQQLELDLFDCHIDTEGQVFCERLRNEVCNDAFDRLLSEPLFDKMGTLNLSISDYPVRIVTTPMSTSHPSFEQQRKKSIITEPNHNTHRSDSGSIGTSSNGRNDGAGEQQQQCAHKIGRTVDTLIENNHPLLIDTLENGKPTTLNELQPRKVSSDTNSCRLLTSQEIWFTLTRHDKFSRYTTDQLCQAVKELAKCSDHGPVLEESDLELIMDKMDRDAL